MEFFIKKNATLPVLKINVIKDGRSDYDRSMRFLQQTDIFFSMVSTSTGIPKIVSRPAGVIQKPQLSTSADTEYYVYYQYHNYHPYFPNTVTSKLQVSNSLP